jgi:ABC-type glycerol-3-phosphate transport system substrate-binding protein
MYRILDWVSNNRKLAIFLAILIVFLLATSIFLFLSGANRNITINKTLPLQGTTVTDDLVWWITDAESTNVEAINAVISGFRVKYPTVNITVENKKNELAMLEEFLSNPDNQPDFMTVSSKDAAFYQKYSSPNQYLKDFRLTDYTERSVDTVKNNNVYSGEIYGVPLHVDNLQMYVNKNLLNNLTGAKIPAKDWETLKLQAASFDKSKGQSLIALGGTSDIVKNYEDILGAMMVQKSIYLDSKNKEINDNDFIQVLKDYNYFKQFLTINSSDYDAFKQGKTLYYIDYYSANDKLKTDNPSLDFQIADIPKYSDGNNISYAKFYTTLAHKDAEYFGDEYKRLVDDFIYYLSTEAAQKIYADKTNFPSANKDIAVAQYKAKNDVDNNRRFYDQAIVARAIIPSCSVRYSNTLNTLLSAVQAKGTDPDRTAIQEVESQYKSALLDTIYNQNVCLPFQFIDKR